MTASPPTTRRPRKTDTRTRRALRLPRLGWGWLGIGVYRDIHHCHAAVIVTTAGYTRSAADTNAMLHQPIRLIDGPQLEAWANGGRPPWA
jgi:hypothetical protein